MSVFVSDCHEFGEGDFVMQVLARVSAAALSTGKWVM